MDYFPDSNVVLVQLTDSAAMEAAISEPEHQIGNEMIRISVITIHHWYPQDISILNDDCIRAIFEKLPLSDLSAVAEVCRPYKTLAKSEFAKKFAHFDTSKHFSEMTERVDDIGSSSENVVDCSNEKYPVAVLKRVFRNFGSSMKSLYLSNKFIEAKYNNLVVKLMAVYCSGADSILTKLTFDDFVLNNNLSASTVQQMKLLFEGLTYVGISYGSHHKQLAQLLSVCSELTELILMEVPCFDDFLRYKCEKLVTVRLRGTVKDNTIAQLAQSNSHIKNLIIDNIRVGINAKIFSIVGTMFPDLKKLAILHGITMNAGEKTAKQHINQLASLQHLNSLTMYCYGLPVPQIIDTFNKAAVPIQNLILSNFELDSNAADSISKMSKLVQLQLNKVRVGSDQLVKIAKNAAAMESLALLRSLQPTVAEIKAIAEASNKLTKLAIVNTKSYIFKQDDYKEIAKSVENRGNGTKLVIAGLLSFRLKVSNESVEENLRWLEITGLWPKGFESFNIAGNRSDESSDEEEEEASDEESEFSGIEDLYYAITSDADRASGNDPLSFIHQISQQQRKMESVLVLRTAHEMGVSSQFGTE